MQALQQIDQIEDIPSFLDIFSEFIDSYDKIKGIQIIRFLSKISKDSHEILISNINEITEQFIDNYIENSLEHFNDNITINDIYDIIKTFIHRYILTIYNSVNFYIDFDFNITYRYFVKILSQNDIIIKKFYNMIMNHDCMNNEFIFCFTFIIYYNHSFVDTLVNNIDNRSFDSNIEFYQNLKDIVSCVYETFNNTNDEQVNENIEDGVEETKQTDISKNNIQEQLFLTDDIIIQYINDNFIQVKKVRSNIIIKSLFNEIKITDEQKNLVSFLMNFIIKYNNTIFNSIKNDFENGIVNSFFVDIFSSCYQDERIEEINNCFINYIKNKIEPIVENINSVQKFKFDIVSPLINDMIQFFGLFRMINEHLSLKLTLNNRKIVFTDVKNIIKYINYYIDYYICKQYKIDVDAFQYMLTFIEQDKFLYGYQQLLQTRILTNFDNDNEIYYYNIFFTNKNNLLNIISDVFNGRNIDDKLIIINDKWRISRNNNEYNNLNNIISNFPEIQTIIDYTISDYINQHPHRRLLTNYEYSTVTFTIETDKAYQITIPFIQYMIIKSKNDIEMEIINYMLVCEWGLETTCDTCAICRNKLTETSIEQQAQGNYDTNNIIVIGMCGHGYHEDCISRWTQKHNNCPTCQKEWIVDHIETY